MKERKADADADAEHYLDDFSSPFFRPEMK